MARAIDADRLLQELMKMEVLTLDRKDLFTGPARIAVFGMIGEQPTLTPPNEWVSVEDRLPEREKLVIVYVGGEVTVDTRLRAETSIVGDWAIHQSRADTITHWMPLPAPPNCRPPDGRFRRSGAEE